MRIHLGLLTLLLGCSSDPAHGTPDAGPDAAPPLEPAFEADEGPAGPVIALAGTIDAGSVQLRVVGRGLGPVFGLSYHLRWDPALTLEGDVVQEPVLADGESRVLAVLEPSGISLGGSRLDATLGEVDLAGDQELAHLTLHSDDPGAHRIEVERVMVRRSDGTFTTAAAKGGLATVTP